MAEPFLVETVTDRLSAYLGPLELRWMCQPPAVGVAYRVVEEEWNDDFTVRTIKQVELVAVEVRHG